ncbi:unnamed protein product [Cochlearia groenlandica]
MPLLGFGKDKTNGVYKLVWLYNSESLGLDNITTCDVFSFETNAWKNLTTSSSSSPYGVVYGHHPTHVDGSLHWLSHVYDSKRHIVSFDLYTETFGLIKTPINTVDYVAICNLNDHLCISERKGMEQKIWSLNSDNNNKNWEMTYSIDLDIVTSFCFSRKPVLPTQAITTLKKDRILLFHPWRMYGRM